VWLEGQKGILNGDILEININLGELAYSDFSGGVWGISLRMAVYTHGYV
jgi:hypothetical protein